LRLVLSLRYGAHAVASAWATRTEDGRRSHRRLNDKVLLTRGARQLSPAHRVATPSRGIVPLALHSKVGERGGWGVQPFGAIKVFKCAHCSTEIVGRNLQKVASAGHPYILTSFWPFMCVRTAGLFLFAFIGSYVVWSSEIYDLRLVCPLNIDRKPCWRGVLNAVDPSRAFHSLEGPENICVCTKLMPVRKRSL